MEDSKKVKAQPQVPTPKANRVIELTPEMETRTATGAKIIELTQVLNGPSVHPAVSPQTVPGGAADAAAAPEVLKPAQPASADIDADIDAAFDGLQAQDADRKASSLLSGDAAMELRPGAETRARTDSTTEPELELSIENLPDDVPLQLLEEEPAAEKAAASGPSAPAADHSGASADDTLDLTDIVLPIDLISAAGPAEPSPDEKKTLADATGAAIPALKEEELIELNDIVDPAELKAVEDEEVIELTDIVLPDEWDAAGYQEQEEVIELTDIVDPAELAAAEDEEVIELTDIAAPDELEATSSALARREPEDEPVIELTDRVDGAAKISAAPPADSPQDGDNAVPTAPPIFSADPEEDRGAGAQQTRPEDEILPAGADEPAKPHTLAYEDEVLRLDDVLNRVRRSQSKLVRDIKEELTKDAADRARDSGPAGGVEGNEEKTPAAATVMPTEKDIEKAIEKILQTKYAQTIESLIAKVVEKVVTREMESIKRSLMEGEE
ncbi:MAG: hypothetical protein C4519_24490 [Desulfobacteraceae bacterium]|nr:MAG: hypothetical protein C4519_24490 [Desulfobacteraceae bacterium]